MKRSTIAPHATVAATLATLLVLSACGAGTDSDGAESSPGDTTGVTDDTVTIGAHFPLTGVAAPGYKEIPTGAQAYFDFVNANGGVHGRQIEYVVRDDGYNPTNTTKVTNELLLQDEIFAMVGGLGTPTHSAVVDQLNDEGVPDLFVSSGSLMWGDDPDARPMTFGWQPDYESEAKIIAQYVAEEMPNAKVGLFLQDDDFGEDAEKGVRQYLDDQIVAVERYASGNTDVGPQVAALQGAKADLVLAFTTPAYTALAKLVSLSLGYQPDWFVSSVGSDSPLVGSLLKEFSEGAVTAGAGALDGVLTTEYIPTVDQGDDPWVQLWEQVWEEHGKGGKLSNYRIYGMSHAYAFVQALQGIGEDLTREKLVEFMKEEGADLEGPQLAPFRFGDDSHLGISGMRIVELEGAGSKPLTPVLVTDIGDAEITEDTSGQAEDAPPSSGLPE
ncbi:ABC transporter substrate-binding protein [Nocardioides sp. Y6]|uniref:ABC transporter substrate-binding protein n=1 Tax=Nocardioides malaquae TaxID=2773426 RepID=A0ABR9RR47_9ACTN|nr:ABC transporter substrate-binding protein [Nocardioides malaquae]MBE7323870.1 ABC transporter substrate-binding protein [Nocardioides malaquae]